jgi:formate dehydrogenase subunit beta
MDAYWKLKTHGDPLGAVCQLVDTIWQQAHLDGMYVPLNGGSDQAVQPRLIRDRAGLAEVNPFKPLMTVNTARLLYRTLKERPEYQLGALLRPCELRALIEMVKHDSFTLDQLLTINIDCLGTLPADEFEWRARRKEVPDGMTREAIQFARQGGILAYRYRSACQMCVSPEARGADINIGVLGLPVRQHLLINVSSQATDRLGLAAVSDGPAEASLITQHARVAARLAERNRDTVARVREGLVELLPRDVEALAAQLEACEDCQACMSVCPICAVAPPQRGADGHYPAAELAGWLVSCAGCGMCEQSCPNHLPLSIIFRQIHEELIEASGYSAGRSIQDPLPLL